MKKRIFILGLILILAIGLVGCARKAEAQNTNKPGDQSAPTGVTAWAGFTENKSIWKGSLNQDRKLINDQSLPIYRLDSTSDLDRFKSEHNSVYSFDQSFEEVPSFEEVAVKYNDSFFTEHSVLVVYISSGRDILRYSVRDIQYEDTKLLVNVQTDYSVLSAYSEDNPVGTAGWFILMEIGKADYQDCSSYDALFPYML